MPNVPAQNSLPRPFTPDDVKTFVMFVEQGDVQMMKLELRDKPGIVNASYDGYTMLHHAVMAANADSVDFLLSRNADPALKSEHGELPVQLATRLSYTSLADKITAKVKELNGSAAAEKTRADFEKAVEGFSKGTARQLEMPKPRYPWMRER